ncbi:DUF397 domain-containing protein [Streptomyces roseifaciens]
MRLPPDTAGCLKAFALRRCPRRNPPRCWRPSQTPLNGSEAYVIRHNLPPHAWRKSSYSSSDVPNCIEMQPTPDALVAIGDSKDRPRGALTLSPRAWTTFVHSIRRSEGAFQPVS